MKGLSEHHRKWARLFAAEDSPWPTVDECMEIHPGLSEADILELCSLLQNLWTKRTASLFANSLCCDVAFYSKFLDHTLTERWHRQTENVKTFTGYVNVMETHGGYCDWPVFFQLFRHLFFETMMNRLLEYRGVYTIDELDKITPAGDLVTFFTGRDRMMLIFEYMQRMQNLKDRGLEWTEKMEELVVELTILDSQENFNKIKI